MKEAKWPLELKFNNIFIKKINIHLGISNELNTFLFKQTKWS